MPFTLSHAVLAPPLAKLSGNRLPIAALAIGCMVPDLFRLFSEDDTGISHHWHAVLYPDLAIGLAFCLLWYLLYRPVLYRFFGLRHDLNIQSLSGAMKFSLAACIAVIAGTATHIIWDGLTHADFRTFAFKNILQQPVSFGSHIYPLHRVLQIGSSAAVLPVLVWMCWRYYRQRHQHGPVQAKIKYAVWSILAVSAAAGLLKLWLFFHSPFFTRWSSDLYEIIGRSCNEFAQGALTAFSICCLIFLIFDRGQRLG